MESPTSEVVTMDAPTEERSQWLTREEIDSVIESMSARDLVDAMDRFDPKEKSTQYAVAAFDSAATRTELSNGTPASAHIRMSDFSYLASRIGEAVNIESPLPEGQEG